MISVTITAVSRKEKVSTRTNKPFTSLGLKTREHGEKWLSGFGNASNAGWKVGDTVDIEVEQKGDFLNFSTPKNANGTEKPRSMSETGETARLANVISIKLLPVLERIAVALEAQNTAPDGYPDSDNSNTPNF